MTHSAVTRRAAPEYRLDLNVNQSRDPRGLRLDNVAERYALTITVDYTLDLDR